MKMTVAVWRPDGVNTMGAARRIDDDMVDDGVVEDDGGCRNARTELVAPWKPRLPHRIKIKIAISGTDRLTVLAMGHLDMNFAKKKPTRLR